MEDEQIFTLLSKHKKPVSAEWIHERLPECNLESIVQAINRLATEGKAMMLQSGTKILFQANVMDASSAAIVSNMSGDERIIYGLIHQASSQGIWTKDLKFKSNLHQNVITKILKSLESRKLIKAVKSVKHATRKVYMLYNVQPSREVTGGPWFTDSELDTDFIESLSNLIHRYIISRSIPSNNSQSNGCVSLYSLDYVGYPTVPNVLRFIKEAKITSTELVAEDISCLLDTLIYDGKIEKITSGVSIDGEIMYKACNAVGQKTGASSNKDKQQSGKSNSAISAVPCGSCPVFHVCSYKNTLKGPISPLNCEYLERWLLDF